MLKRVKKLVIFLVCISVIFSVIYVCTTNNNYDRKLFLSHETATKKWGTKASKLFFEYSDENFYIQFDVNYNIKSVRKEGLFWVRNQYDGFPASNKINKIRSTTVNDIVYIYGVTKYNNVKEIKLVDSNSNEKAIEFIGKKISNIDGLCFCAKIPADSLVLSYEIVFINENGNIISDLFQNENQDLQTYISHIQSDLSNNKYTRILNQNLSLSTYASSKHKIQEKFYLVRDGKEFFLQEVSQNVDIYFLDEYALVVERMEFLQVTLIDTKNNFYTTTYKATYDENLSNFRKYILNDT